MGNRNQPRILLGMRSYDGLIRQLYAHYKQKAKKRELVFLLDIEDFKGLISQPCFYCGELPKQVYRPTRYKTPLIYNGIDRVTNELGYTSSNCVTCCKKCNRAKSTLTQKEFFVLITKIYRKHCFEESFLCLESSS